MSAAPSEPVIYREEVLAILSALADMVVELKNISTLLGEDDEETEEETD